MPLSDLTDQDLDSADDATFDAYQIKTIESQAEWLAEFLGETLAGELLGHQNKVYGYPFNALLSIPAAFSCAEDLATSDPAYKAVRCLLFAITERMERQVGWEILDYLRAASKFGPEAREKWEELEGHLQRFKASVEDRWDREPR